MEKGKYVIVTDLNFTDHFKDINGEVKLFNDLEEVYRNCGMYELENVFILKIEDIYSDNREDCGTGDICCGKRMVEESNAFVCSVCGAWNYSSS